MSKVEVSFKAFMFHAAGDAEHVKAAMDQAFGLLGSVMQAALPAPEPAPRKSRKKTPAVITATERPVKPVDQPHQ